MNINWSMVFAQTLNLLVVICILLTPFAIFKWLRKRSAQKDRQHDALMKELKSIREQLEKKDID